MNIPLCKTYIDQDEINIVTEVLKSGWLAPGQKNKLFEKEFARYINVKKAISLNSCTSALFLVIKSLRITGEVILPSFTFVASANAIVTAGAKPVFVDIEYDTCNISPEKIKDAITDKTQAIMPVHFGGQSCKMDEIMEIAEQHDLKVIEDSAETIGGTFKGKKTGSFGIGCFSFYPTKNITCGEGGMITTNDEELAAKINALKAHGIDSNASERERKEKPWLRNASCAGYNFRLCDVLAGIGLVQLRKVDKMNELRRKHAKFLTQQLSGIENIDLPLESKDCKHVYQMYTLKLKGTDRTKFISFLKERGIGVSVHFDPPVHEQLFYSQGNFRKEELKITESVAKSIVTLPMFPGLNKEELNFMVESIEDAIKNLKNN